MESFQVMVYEIFGICEEIDAKDTQQALKIAEQRYIDGEIVVGDKDYLTPIFKVKANISDSGRLKN